MKFMVFAHCRYRQRQKENEHADFANGNLLYILVYFCDRHQIENQLVVCARVIAAIVWVDFYISLIDCNF